MVLAAAAGAALAAPDGSSANLAALGPDELDALVRRIARMASIEERLAAASRPFLGTPYLDSPLGEGFGVDQDPRVRFDHVDCLTFVELVLAMANAQSYLAAQVALDDIRYSDGAPAFEDRNHLMEAQWLPRNQKKGYLEDITRAVAGDAATEVVKVVTRASWKARRVLKELELPEGKVPLGTWKLPVIPIDAARSLVERIPAGTLLSVARADHWTFPGRITHVGLVIDKKGRRFLRHGARSVYGKVVDEPLDAFLERNARYQKWPVVGVNLQRVNDNRKRVAEIVGPSLARP